MKPSRASRLRALIMPLLDLYWNGCWSQRDEHHVAILLGALGHPEFDGLRCRSCEKMTADQWLQR